jgi:polyhydroxybutyrate depolymerase
MRFLLCCVVLWVLSTSLQAQTTATCTLFPTEQHHTFSLTVDGEERTYIQYLPEQYSLNTRLAIVFSFHGLASDAEEQIERTDFSDLADEQGFIVIYPQGTGDPALWYNGTSTFNPQDDLRDVRFFEALLDHLENTLCMDSMRVYVNGFSAGGGMAYRLGCQFADRITAIGTMSGAFADIPNGCNPARPLPVIAIHGEVDPIVRYEGIPGVLPAAQDWIAEWAERNACENNNTQPLTPEISVLTYDDCAENVQVQLVSIANNGHRWAGTQEPARNSSFLLGQPTQDLSASEAMWEFFQAFQLE